MDSTERPDADGRFNPLGHVIVSFPTVADMQGALAALFGDGFADDEVIVFSPEQMKRQAQTDIEQAGPLASIGQDLNLMKANLRLAEQGHSFLVVRAPKDEHEARVAAIARRFHATRAQKYNLLLIEELIDPGTGENQVFESSDRGLDEQAPSDAAGSTAGVGGRGAITPPT